MARLIDDCTIQNYSKEPGTDENSCALAMLLCGGDSNNLLGVSERSQGYSKCIQARVVVFA